MSGWRFVPLVESSSDGVLIDPKGKRTLAQFIARPGFWTATKSVSK